MVTAQEDENFPYLTIPLLSFLFRFNSSVGGFVYADQFLQISSLLPSHNIYGLGEHVMGLKLNTVWQQLTLFSRDIATPHVSVTILLGFF